MYKITWDKDTGGVLLHSRIVDGTLGVSPRPVFYEELDLLGLDKMGWEYPHCQEPLLWAVNKQYYYRGDFVFEAKGANIYDSATIVFADGMSNIKMNLKPVDMDVMLKRNRENLFTLESEAIEFIYETYNQYAKARKSTQKVASNQLDYEALAKRIEAKRKQKMAIVKEDCDSFEIMPLDVAEEQGKKVYQTTKIDRFLASFSGGKDSQVVLDLCTRAMPSTEFEVIYSDTGYELPPSLELYEKVQKLYHERFPDLQFRTAKNHAPVLEYWNKIGTPSDKHRWCCAVMKTAPLYRALQDDGMSHKFLAFEGVRAEESGTRQGYERIGRGVKHNNVINARPILNWNTTEIFLYLFLHRLPINAAYRVGKPRVGCLICPFSSPWDDMVVNRNYPEELAPFLNRLVDIARKRKIPNLNEYISEHKWKLRASGNNMPTKTAIEFIVKGSCFIAKVINGKYDVTKWLQTIGDFTYHAQGQTGTGDIKIGKNVHSFEINRKGSNEYSFLINGIVDNNIIPLLKRVVYKSAYCISCEACEVECPTGALSVYPKLEIDKTKCVQCHKCLVFHDAGCIVANSLAKSMSSRNLIGSISSYGTFGIHEEWVEEFLDSKEDFWNANSLGNKQVSSFKAWLKDSEIVDSKYHLTQFGQYCSEMFMDERDTIWQIVWTHFCYNNPLVKWFVENIRARQQFDRILLIDSANDYFGGAYTETSIKYAIGAFMQILNPEYAPFGGELKQGVDISDGKMKDFIREGNPSLTPKSIAYSIYRYSEQKGVHSLRVSDLYHENCDGGPAFEFGIDKASLVKILRALNAAQNRLLTAELNMGLDSITLREDITSMDILKF